MVTHMQYTVLNLKVKKGAMNTIDELIQMNSYFQFYNIRSYSFLELITYRSFLLTYIYHYTFVHQDKQKAEKMAILAQERQRKKVEMQQRWTRREEADFYRVVSTFGVVFDRAQGRFNWDRFRLVSSYD